MLALEGTVAGTRVRGMAGPAAASVIRVERIGYDASSIGYRGAAGPAEIIFPRDNEPGLKPVQHGRPFSIGGDGETAITRLNGIE